MKAQKIVRKIGKKSFGVGMKGWMYILECADGSYYIGSTNDLDLRIKQHENGEGANHTQKNLPIKLVYKEVFQRIDEAFYREKQVQGWSRKKKEALINGEYEKLPPLSKNYTQYPPLTEPVEGNSNSVVSRSSEVVVSTGSTTENKYTTTKNTSLSTEDTPVTELVEGNQMVVSTGSTTENKYTTTENTSLSTEDTPVTELVEGNQMVVSTGSTTENTSLSFENLPLTEPVEGKCRNSTTENTISSTENTPLAKPVEDNINTA